MWTTVLTVAFIPHEAASHDDYFSTFLGTPGYGLSRFLHGFRPLWQNRRPLSGPTYRDFRPLVNNAAQTDGPHFHVAQWKRPLSAFDEVTPSVAELAASVQLVSWKELEGFQKDFPSQLGSANSQKEFANEVHSTVALKSY